MYLIKAQHSLAARKLHEALRLFDKAEANGEAPAVCAAGKWESFMLLGEYEAAWLQSDLLRSSGISDVHRLWQGESIHQRRVIVRCLHGLGDAIQFLRYARQLRDMAEELYIQVPPALVQLANQIEGVAPAITWDTPKTPSPEWDVQVELMQLPHLFRALSHSVPSHPYLHIPSTDTSRVKTAMLLREARNGLPRVGLCWHCGKWNTNRAIPSVLLQPLLDVETVQFYNLNEASNDDAWVGLKASSRCHDASVLGDGPLSLAAVIANMDLIITVDTMVAHLAGAMGKPVWLMLQYAADWRWMDTRSDSPWYPTMRIFRQSGPGDWPSVILAIINALRTNFPYTSGGYAELG